MPTTTFTNGNSNGLWSDLLNWDNGVPGDGYDVVLDGTSTDECVMPAEDPDHATPGDGDEHGETPQPEGTLDAF